MINQELIEQKRAELYAAQREVNKWREADKVVKVRYQTAYELERHIQGELEQIIDQQARNINTPTQAEIDEMIARLFPVDVTVGI